MLHPGRRFKYILSWHYGFPGRPLSGWFDIVAPLAQLDILLCSLPYKCLRKLEVITLHYCRRLGICLEQ